jgi:hypothetical protein
VSLAVRGGALAAAWYDTRDGNAEIYARKFALSDIRGSGDLRLTTTTPDSYEPDIVALGDGFAVAWYEKDREGHLAAQFGIWSDDGESIHAGLVSPTPLNTRNPVLVAADGRIFIAWIESDAAGHEHVWARWLSDEGAALGDPLLVRRVGATTWNLNAAIDPAGVAYLVFDAESGTRAEEIFAARIAERTVSIRQISADDGFASKYPDIAFVGDCMAVTWFDNRYGNNEVFFGVTGDSSYGNLERDALRVTVSDGDSIGAYITAGTDEFGLVWSDDEGGHYDVYFQVFDIEGRPRSEARRLSFGTLESLIPAVQSLPPGYAIVWNEVAGSEGGYHDESTGSEILFAFVGP